MSYSPGDIDYCSECEHVVEGEVDFTGLCPYCGWEIRDPDKGVVKLFTNAPKCYDYGNTREVEDDTGWRHTSGLDCDRPIREIWIRDEYYARIQKDRNLSGLYPSLTEEEFEQWKTDGFLVEVTNG